MKLPALAILNGYTYVLNNGQRRPYGPETGIVMAACTPQEVRDHMEEVSRYCRRPYACRPGDDCPTLLEKSLRAHNCYVARANINRDCFDGGDPGHRIAANDAYTSSINCRNRYNNMRCTT